MNSDAGERLALKGADPRHETPDPGAASSLSGHTTPEPARSSFFAWLKQADDRVAFLKGLSVVAAIGTLVGSYFQYKSAQHEKALTQYKEDFHAATQTFVEAAVPIQSAMRLQHALFITFSEAVRTKVYTDEKAFLTKSARDLYPQYVSERLSLRKSIDVLAHKVEIYIDWASDLDRGTTAPGTRPPDPLNNQSILGTYDFDCDQHLLQQGSLDLASKENESALHLDWNRAKHQIYTFYYCFERTHDEIRAARQWASGSLVDPLQARKLIPVNEEPGVWQNKVEKMHGHVRESLNKAVVRLANFNGLVIARIEQIRFKHETRGYETRGYLCHATGLWC